MTICTSGRNFLLVFTNADRFLFLSKLKYIYSTCHVFFKYFPIKGNNKSSTYLICERIDDVLSVFTVNTFFSQLRTNQQLMLYIYHNKENHKEFPSYLQ